MMTFERPCTYADFRHEKHTGIPHADSISILYQQYRAEHAMNTYVQNTLYGSTSTPVQHSLLETLFTRLIDAVIFTSAVAITAYNYWTGNLNLIDQVPFAGGINRRAGAESTEWRQTQNYTKHQISPNTSLSYRDDPLYDIRRRRTEEWTEDIMQHQQQQLHYRSQDSNRKHHSRENSRHKHNPHYRSLSANAPLATHSKSSLLDSVTAGETIYKSKHGRSKKRSLSFDYPNQEKQDAMLSRMQLKLQALIKEGEAALARPVELDDNTTFYNNRGLCKKSDKLKRFHSA